MVVDVSTGYLAEDNRLGPRVALVVTATVSFIIVCLRLYARGIIAKQLGLDDYTMVAAWFLGLLQNVFSSKLLDCGAGLHQAAITPAMTYPLFKYRITSQSFYMATLWLCRSSGLLFYARIGGELPRFKTYLWMAFAFCTATLITQVMLVFFQCIPLASSWNHNVPGRCLGPYVVFIPAGTLAIVCDGLILFLPLKIVFTMHATLFKKFILGVLLCFGVFAVVVSVLRMVANFPLANSKDGTWHFAKVIAWSAAEVSSAIVALSIPSLGLLLRRQKSDVPANRKTPAPADPNEHALRTFAGTGGAKLKKAPNVRASRIPSAPNSSEENLWEDETAPGLRLEEEGRQGSREL